MALIHTLHLSHLSPDLPIYISLFKDVKNAAFLRSQLLSGNTDFEYTFVDASVIISSNHILAAVFRAINDMLNNRLKSRNVHSEIVFSLSPNNNIAESFRRFGISDTTSSFLIIKIPVDPAITDQSVQQHLSSVIEGTAIEFSDENLSTLTDLARVRKIYKLNSGGEKKSKKPSKESELSKPEATRGNEDESHEKKELEVAILGIMALRGAN